MNIVLKRADQMDIEPWRPFRLMSTVPMDLYDTFYPLMGLKSGDSKKQVNFCHQGSDVIICLNVPSLNTHRSRAGLTEL